MKHGSEILLVTGAGGLIGSEVVSYFSLKGWKVIGIDNNMRADFFGKEGDVRWNLERLRKEHGLFEYYDYDIRDRKQMLLIFSSLKPNAVVHTAAQPSHDLAALRPFDDFDVNAVGTFNLLEALRSYSINIPFVHMSTNKVYGDRVNGLKFVETESRWDYSEKEYFDGIDENFSIDQSKHSIFGASKVAADIMVQEYGRYFDMPTCSLRGGCLTGPFHSGVELHGFLNYLIKCNYYQKNYTVYGYKGKQVRDNIHSYDVASLIYEFIKNPRIAEVYNLGGGRKNSISILEAFKLASNFTQKEMIFEYDEKNREGDHICYISNLKKIKSHYKNWQIKKDLNTIFKEILDQIKSNSAM